jgi:hypothetical protein
MLIVSHMKGGQMDAGIHTMRQYPLRISSERFAMIERFAEEENRSVNQQLVQLIDEAVKARMKHKKRFASRNDD